eukprot:evm.model.NODE_32286_length_32794_cov_31.879429.2
MEVAELQESTDCPDDIRQGRGTHGKDLASYGRDDMVLDEMRDYLLRESIGVAFDGVSEGAVFQVETKAFRAGG